MGWLAKAIEPGGASRATLAEVEEGPFIDLGDRRAKQSQFWVLLALSSLIAAGGVAGNSTPAVIGAMIVAPLATPIYGIALATVIGSPRRLRTALLLLIGGIALNIALGVIVGLITALRMPLESNPQIIGRTSPSLLDLGVALVTGLAGSFALARRDVSNILAGVAIAISLVPVLAVVGITLGAGRFDLAWGATVLFLTNVAAILIAGVLVFSGRLRGRGDGARCPGGRPRPGLHRGLRRPRDRAPVVAAGLAVRPLGGRDDLGIGRLGQWHRLAGRVGPGRGQGHRGARHRAGQSATDRVAAKGGAAQRAGEGAGGGRSRKRDDGAPVGRSTPAGGAAVRRRRRGGGRPGRRRAARAPRTRRTPRPLRASRTGSRVGPRRECRGPNRG